MQISVDNNGNCKRTETKNCCITIFPPIFVEEITYTTEWRNMSPQARHLCDFDQNASSR